MWKVTLVAAHKQVEAAERALTSLGEADNPPTLTIFEVPDSSNWKVEAYLMQRPERRFLESLGLEFPDIVVEPVPDTDWVTESQRLLPPIEAGRFFIHGAHDKENAKAGRINLEVDAGQAFGTGSHGTTKACLLALDELTKGPKPANALDLGTGTGILAMAMTRAFGIPVLASDNDPIAVDVATENARSNAIDHEQIRYLTAEGTDHSVIRTHAPFDLITANILAGPLITMAADIAVILATGGRLILSGLLQTQEAAIERAYLNEGLTVQSRFPIGDWQTLVMTKP